MMEIDRRTMLRGVLFGVGLVTVGGVAVTTAPELAEAVPLAKPEAVPRADDKAGPVGTDDPLEGRIEPIAAVYGGVVAVGSAPSSLERDDFSLHRHPALASCLSMIFSENRCTLFGIMR